MGNDRGISREVVSNQDFHFRAVNAEFFQGYGLTETSPIATLSPKGTTNYATVGWTGSNCQSKVVAVDDTTLKGVDTNVLGELFIRGPNIMLGYFLNDEATRAMITPDGWLRTGDIVSYDEHGLYYIRDRIKELIKVNAYQVAPAELEAVLRCHPDIVDAVVVGIPHATYGEVPRAFVVKRQGANTSEDNVKQFVAAQVAKYKKLTGGVYFVESIPKTATGKILRREVKRLYCWENRDLAQQKKTIYFCIFNFFFYSPHPDWLDSNKNICITFIRYD